MEPPEVDRMISLGGEAIRTQAEDLMRAIYHRGERFLPHLDHEFIDLMNKLGEYGFQKHGQQSFQARRLRGDGREDHERMQTKELARHAREHFEAYQAGMPHDHFGDLEMQLAAVAYNAMMEFYYLRKEQDDGVRSADGVPCSADAGDR